MVLILFIIETASRWKRGGLVTSLRTIIYTRSPTYSPPQTPEVQPTEPTPEDQPTPMQLDQHPSPTEPMDTSTLIDIPDEPPEHTGQQIYNDAELYDYDEEPCGASAPPTPEPAAGTTPNDLPKQSSIPLPTQTSPKELVSPYLASEPTTPSSQSPPPPIVAETTLCLAVYTPPPSLWTTLSQLVLRNNGTEVVLHWANGLRTLSSAQHVLASSGRPPTSTALNKQPLALLQKHTTPCPSTNTSPQATERIQAREAHHDHPPDRPPHPPLQALRNPHLFQEPTHPPGTTRFSDDTHQLGLCTRRPLPLLTPPLRPTRLHEVAADHHENKPRLPTHRERPPIERPSTHSPAHTLHHVSQPQLHLGSPHTRTVHETSPSLSDQNRGSSDRRYPTCDNLTGASDRTVAARGPLPIPYRNHSTTTLDRRLFIRPTHPRPPPGPASACRSPFHIAERPRRGLFRNPPLHGEIQLRPASYTHNPLPPRSYDAHEIRGPHHERTIPTVPQPHAPTGHTMLRPLHRAHSSIRHSPTRIHGPLHRRAPRPPSGTPQHQHRHHNHHTTP